MDNRNLLECLEFAVQAARRAGAVTLEYFRAGATIETKCDGSPVTIADRRSEEELRRLIHGRFPDDAILGEEFGEQAGSSGRRWILDPLDGTQSFIHGVPLFGVLIGMEANGEALLGVSYLPALDEIVYAAHGLGCWWQPAGEKIGEPRRAGVSNVARLGDGLLITSGFEYFVQANRSHAFERLHRAALHTRGWSDCYGQVVVATGRAEAIVEPVMNIWDSAAFLPIFQEAGGTFTDWNGNVIFNGGNSISSNGRVHAELLRLVQE